MVAKLSRHWRMREAGLYHSGWGRQSKIHWQADQGTQRAWGDADYHDSTPIENDLSNLWSCLTFWIRDTGHNLHTGILKAYAKRLEEEHRKDIRNCCDLCVMLRRLKTEINHYIGSAWKAGIRWYITLNKQQVVLYRKLRLPIWKKIKKSEGMERRGSIVLSTIAKAKQICNRISIFGEESCRIKDSGKLWNMKNLWNDIWKEERVLVFTQYKIIPAACYSI